MHAESIIKYTEEILIGNTAYKRLALTSFGFSVAGCCSFLGSPLINSIINELLRDICKQHSQGTAAIVLNIINLLRNIYQNLPISEKLADIGGFNHRIGSSVNSFCRHFSDLSVS